MSDTALRARSASEIVDAAFKLYRRNAGQYILVTGIAYSPSLLVNVFFQPEQAESMMSAIGYLVTALVSIVAMTLMIGTVTSLASRAYLGEPVDVAAAVRQALPRVPTLLLSAILTVVLWIIGLLCFVVGFFYIASRFFATSAVIVIERKGVLASFARSSRLTNGHMWHVFGSLLLVYALYIFGSIAVSAVGLVAGSLVVLTLVTTLYTIVAFPVVALATMVLYYDLRIRAEGFDLERMTQSLDASHSLNAAALS